MTNNQYCFQYCPKIVLFSKDKTKIFLAKRYGEADYDGTFTFIGGKMEVSDKNIIEGIRREKNEEIGSKVKAKLYPLSSHNVLFRKADGSSMVIPHYLALYVSGDIQLNSKEYSEYQWIDFKALEKFEPKIANLPDITTWALAISKFASDQDFVEI